MGSLRRGVGKGGNLIMFCWFERHSTALIDEGHLAHHDFADVGRRQFDYVLLV